MAIAAASFQMEEVIHNRQATPYRSSKDERRLQLMLINNGDDSSATHFPI